MYQIERGGLARSFKGAGARRRIQRETHGVVIEVQGDKTVAEVAAVAVKAGYWWTDLRRGQNTIYGALLRFIDLSVALGVPRRVLLKIPALLHSYIRDQYSDAQDTGDFPMAA